MCGLPYPRAPLLIAKQADGFTYERSAIEQWLETHSTSPTTGVELVSKQLYPCPRGSGTRGPALTGVIDQVRSSKMGC